MNEFQIYDFEKRIWNTVSYDVWESYSGYKRSRLGKSYKEYNKPEDKYRHFYTVETVDEPRKVIAEADEYRDAYFALCKSGYTDLMSGKEPVFYMILSHSVTYWGDTGYIKHSMTQPAWK